MDMHQEHRSIKEDVDFFDLFARLWAQKTTLLLGTLFCGLLGLGYLMMTPGKYVGQFVIRGPIGPQLAAFTPLNDGIKEHYKDFFVATNNGNTHQFELSTESLVRDMIRELQSYQGFDQALKTHVPDIKNMPAAEFAEARPGLLSKFEVLPTTDKNPENLVQLEWSDEAELLDLLTTTLEISEQNLITDKLAELRELANNIKRRDDIKLNELENDVISTMSIIDLKIEARRLLLQEQAAIARELGLAENSLTEGGQANQILLKMTSQGQERNSTQDESILYLRGYKSLEKEIALINSRKNNDNYILDPNFVEAKRQEIRLRNNDAVKLFREAVETSPFALGTDIFGVSKDAVLVKQTRSAPFTLAIFLFLGLFVSSTIVLIRSVVSNRKMSQAT